MPDELRSPIKHHLVLHRIGTTGQELVEIHADEMAAGQALEAVARAKRKRGYRDL
jgi:predicted DNA-binding WGR domain protein